MPLTYAGVDLSPMTEPLAAICERWWVRESPDLWTYPGYFQEQLHHLPVPAPPPHESPRLNTLYWPSGASRWGVLHSLVGQTQKEAIQTAVGTVAPAAATLKFDDGNGGVITPSMYMIACRPVFVQDAETGYNLWWVTFVDKRYFWWQKLLSYGFSDGNTWANLLNALVLAASGLTPTVPTINAAYGTPLYTRWNNPGKPLPLLIDAAATACGVRFVFNLDGTADFVLPANAISSDSSQYNAYNSTADPKKSNLVIGGRNVVTAIAGNVPASVNVAYLGLPATARNKTLSGLALADYGSVTGVSGAAGWVVGEQDTSGNATQAATDYYLWGLSLTDATFRGVQPWELTGLEDRIEWEYMPGRWSHARKQDGSDDADDTADVESERLPWERVLTRVVRRDWADRNVYGNIKDDILAGVNCSGFGLGVLGAYVPSPSTQDVWQTLFNPPCLHLPESGIYLISGPVTGICITGIGSPGYPRGVFSVQLLDETLNSSVPGSTVIVARAIDSVIDYYQGVGTGTISLLYSVTGPTTIVMQGKLANSSIGWSQAAVYLSYNDWGDTQIGYVKINASAIVADECCSSSGSGSGSGGGGGNCCAGECGSSGVAGTLTATVTAKVGCFTSFPDTITWTCTDNGIGGHFWFPDSTSTVCGHTNPTSIYCAAGSPPNFGYTNSSGSSSATPAQAGYTCNPFSAVFLVDDGAGNTCTVTVVSP